MPVPFVCHSEVDVLIIGASPAGLMCAKALANARVNVRIVDQTAFKLTTGKGDGILPRTTEVFQLDIELWTCRAPYKGLTSRTPSVTAPSARYPFELTLHQGAIQDIFADSMISLGVKVERSTIPTSIELSKDENELMDPASYPVRVVLQRLDKSEDEPREEIVHAKFVVGCDGARSWVRKQVGITMDGEQSDSIWGVVDMVTPDTDFPDVRNKALVHSNHGSVIFIPREQDRIRIYIQLKDKDLIDPVTGRVDKEKMGPDRILETAQKSLEPYKLIRKSEFLWWTLYSIGQRVASKFSIKNRVFVAGDACHTHFPKAGKRLKSSPFPGLYNDSHNLAWKIARVLRRWADMPFFCQRQALYESERRKFALDLIAWDKMWSTLFSGKPLTEENSDGVSPEDFTNLVLLLILRVCKTFQTDFTSGIGIQYQPSVAVDHRNQELASGLVLGKCVPPCKFMRAADAWPFELQDLLPSDFLFKLLVFTVDCTDPLQQARVESMVTNMQKPKSFLNRYATHGNSRFGIVTISKDRKETFKIFRLLTLLRSHWSKVFIDDTDPSGTFGGEGYSYYGLGPEGALVAVRPDGYVGAIAPLDHIGELDAYFASFMKIPV
ncbi:FAD binding domain-containing protein [Suillus subalutaceus]|uniref:FAD binding domain-containing protein n=1 Tax=Suillus subalutaceus TaxID=48586 RepID=UPI001B85B8B5|nr:FAD binding domain-containing protein [Suillus subalutaceus]KAG1848094.1 FAD binding domain-containing protein [Suillus subalutaceus]